MPAISTVPPTRMPPAVGVTILPALLDITSVEDENIEWNAQQAAALPLISMLVEGKIEAALI